jgi:hypothetical protein
MVVLGPDELAAPSSGSLNGEDEACDGGSRVRRLYFLNKCDLLTPGKLEVMEKLVQGSSEVVLGSCVTGTGFHAAHKLLVSRVESM